MSRSLLLFLSLASTGLAATDDDVVDFFDPATAWPDFQAIEMEVPRLQLRAYFEFDRYEKYQGKSLTTGKIAELYEQWQVSKARGYRFLEKFKDDPYEKAALGCGAEVEAEIKRYYPGKKFLRSRTGEERDAALFQDIEMFFEVLPIVEQDSMHTLENEYRSALSQYLRWFDGEFAEPLWLKRRSKSRPFLALVFFADREQYAHLHKSKDGEATWARAHYDPSLEMAFSYEIVEGETALEKLNPVFHELTHAVLDSLHAGRMYQAPIFLNEGLAEYCSEFEAGESGKPFEFGKRPREKLQYLARAWSDEVEREVMFLDLAELFGTLSYQDAFNTIAQKAQQVDRSIDFSSAVRLFYAESHALAWWLLEGAEKRHRDGFRAYLREEMAGRGGLDVFREKLGVADLADLEQAFRDDVIALAKRHRAADLALLAELAAAAAKTSPPARDALAAIDPKAAGRASPVRATGADVPLVLDSESREEKAGKAVLAARSGMFADALESGREALEDDQESALRKIAAYADRILAGLEAGRVAIEIAMGTKDDGTPSLVERVIRSHDASRLHLAAEGSGAEEVVARSFLPLAELERGASDAGVVDSASSLLLRALIGTLDADSPEPARSLRTRFEDLARAGEARSILERLQAAAESDDVAFHIRDLKRLAELARPAELARSAERVGSTASSLVARHRDALRSLAARAVEIDLRRNGLLAMPIGSTRTELEDGRIEVRHDFRDGREASAFGASMGVPPEWLEDEDPKRLAQPIARGGALELPGVCLFGHAVEWSGDFELEMLLEPLEKSSSFKVYAGDAAARQLVTVQDGRSAYYVDRFASRLAQRIPGSDRKAEAPYRLRIRQSGSKVFVSVGDGEPAVLNARLPPRSRLMIRSEAKQGETRIEELVLRVNADDAWLESARSAAIDAWLDSWFPAPTVR